MINVLKSYYFIAGLILIINNSLSFSQNYYFNNTYDISTLSVSVIEIQDGYVVSGQIYLTDRVAITLIKLNFKGDTIWTKVYGEINKLFFSNRLFEMEDKSLIASGDVNDTTGANPDFMLMKFDEFGNFLWRKTYGDSGQNVIRNCIRTKDKGFMLVGIAEQFVNPPGYPDAYVVKTDSAGNFEWEKRYGGSSDDYGYTAVETDDNGYLIAGSTKNLIFGAIRGIYLVKTDSIGNFQWDKTYTGLEHRYSGLIKQLSDGNYLIASAEYVQSTKRKALLIKIEPTGAVIWEKTYQPKDYSVFFNIPIENLDGTIVIAGAVKKGTFERIVGWLLKVDAMGDTIWSKEYYTQFDEPDKGGNYIWDIKPTPDSGYIFCGSAWDITQDTWVVKIDSNGNDCFQHFDPDSACISFGDTTVGILDESQNTKNNDLQIWVYPNPFSLSATIYIVLIPTGTTKESLSFSLYDLLGRKQKVSYSFHFRDSNTLEIQLQRGNLQPGLYFYSINNQYKTLASGKLLVED